MDPLLYKLLWIFGWAVVILIAWFVKGARKQRRLELIHAERMAAIEKGLPLPELPDYENHAHRSLRADHHRQWAESRWSLGAGAVFLMLGVGICLALRLSGDEYHNQIWSFGLIGVFLGVGLILHHFLTQPRQ
jgi:hypothetical protein